MGILTGVGSCLVAVTICSSPIISDVVSGGSEKENQKQCELKVTSWDWLLEGVPCFELYFSHLWAGHCLESGVLHRLARFVNMKWPLLLLFSRSVVSNSLQPHGLQHTRLPCPSLSLRVCSDSHPLNLWCHPTISSSVIPFSSWPQSFPASGSFPMSRLFSSGGQSIGASVSAPVLTMNIQG